jgi:hypothetical protein
MRRQDRERMRGEGSEQSRNAEDTGRRDRQSEREQVKGGSTDEPRNKPTERQPGRLPIPD